MRIVLLGKPGSGKGTQAKRIAASKGIPAVSTGDLIRAAIGDGTPLGRQFLEYTERGQLVPDPLVVAVVERRFGEPDCAAGFVLDGFPRTVVQAEALDAWLLERQKPLQRVLNIEVPDAVLVERAAGRRLCSRCGASYHVTFARPERSGLCDVCDGPLTQRSDDRMNVVEERLREYEEKTARVVTFYEKAALLVGIDGVGSPDAVEARIGAVLRGL